MPPKSEWSMAESQVFLTRFMHACPEVELVIDAFPPAVFLPWQKGISPLGPHPVWRCSVPLPWLWDFLSAVWLTKGLLLWNVLGYQRRTAGPSTHGAQQCAPFLMWRTNSLQVVGQANKYLIRYPEHFYKKQLLSLHNSNWDLVLK